jgi:anaerobic selenocysteine-containing dehydrogenase
VEIDAVARKGFSVHRLDGQDDGFKSWEGVRKIIQALVSVNEYKPSIILISGEGVDVEERALLTAEMVVSFSSYLTQSSPYCDLLLPNHHYLEAWDIEPVGRDARRLGQRRPVVQPTHHSRATGDVIVGLAKGLGSPLSETLPWKSHEAAVRSLFSQEIISGLETTGSWSVVPDEASYPSQGSSGSLPKLAWNFINTEVPSPDTSFPFLLVPAWGWGDIFPNLQWVREIPLVSGNPYVPRLEIHPTDAHRLGIRHGESVQLETPHFNVVANAFFRGGLRPGVLAMNRRPMRFSVCQARVRPNL